MRRVAVTKYDQRWHHSVSIDRLPTKQGQRARLFQLNKARQSGGFWWIDRLNAQVVLPLVRRVCGMAWPAGRRDLQMNACSDFIDQMIGTRPSGSVNYVHWHFILENKLGADFVLATERLNLLRFFLCEGAADFIQNYKHGTIYRNVIGASFCQTT